MNIKIPSGSAKLILFQRTDYLVIAKSTNRVIQWLYRSLLGLVSFNTYVTAEALLFSRGIEQKYDTDMHAELESIKAHLPKRVDTLLDIGCGLAGIDALLFDHYKQNPQVFLLDKTEVDSKVFYLYENKGSFYNSLAKAKELLLLNNVPVTHIHTQEVTPDSTIDFDTTFDLVISLISWGFHYPIAVYLDTVYEKMTKGGHLIVDVRKDTDGEKLLRDKFGSLTLVADYPKHQRILAVK